MVAAAAAAVYGRGAGAYFFDDDFQWLVGTWSFRLADLFDLEHRTHFYRPVIELYFAGATPLFGGSPACFHVANICLHAANGAILLALTRALSGSHALAFLAALFFVVQPADVDAITWVSALAEAVSAFFGCLCLLWFLHGRRRRERRWQVLSVAAFSLALLTHESSVVFFLLLVLLAWADPWQPAEHAHRAGWPSRVSAFVPYAVPLAAYLAVDLWINSRNYLVVEGHYAIGFHAFTNLLDYIVAMWVGKGSVPIYVLLTAALIAMLLRGSRRVVFATAWLLVALLPFVFFKWDNTARYLYLPAMAFSMLVAEGVLQIDRRVGSRLTARPRRMLVAILTMAIAGRFAWFAAANVRSFAARTEEYRTYIATFRQIHGDLPPHSRVPPDPRLRSDHPAALLNALVQWEYRDPTIELIAGEPAP